MALTAYADADHAGCRDIRRSTSGSAQFLGDKLVSWSSKKQQSTAISTIEAEYIAMSTHIDIRHHFIREQVKKGVVELYFVSMDYQLADIFTKALPRQRFEFILPRLGDNDGDDDANDLSEDDANDEDEEESSDSEEEEEEHLASTVPAPALYSSVCESDETEPFEEGETAATPPPFGYRIAARMSVQPHILMPFRSESEVERLFAIPTPPLSPVSLTSYTLPPLLMPLPLYTPLPTSSFPLPSSIPSTSGSESIPEADIPLRKRARFTTPTSRYEIGESSVAAARQIRPTLTIAESRRANDGLIGRLRRERRYFRTLATTYAEEVAHSRDYCTRIMDYCQSREVHTSAVVTQMEALRRDVNTLQGSISSTLRGMLHPRMAIVVHR
nr:copia protein [Tanacetum cinerariifolium]